MSVDRTNGQARTGGRRHGWRRGLGLGLLIVGVLIGIAICATAWVITNLDHPVVKDRWTAGVREATGLDVEVATLSASLSGRLTLTGLRVSQPPARRAAATDLVAVDALDARLDLPALLDGRLRLEPTWIRGVRLALVQDESGRTSLDDLGVSGGEEAAKAPAAPATPLSRVLQVEGVDLDVASLALREVQLSRIRTVGGKVMARESVEGLDIDLAVRITGGLMDATATLASPDEGTQVRTWRANAGGAPSPPPGHAAAAEVDSGGSDAGARARFRLSAAVKRSRETTLSATAELLDQTFDATLPRADLRLAVEAAATFDPDAGEIRARLGRLDVAGGALAANASLTVPDQPHGGVLAVLDPIRVEARTDPVATALRALFPALGVSGASLSMDASGLALLDHAPFVALGGPASVRFLMARGAYADADRRADVTGLDGLVEARLGPDGVLSTDIRFSAQALAAEAGGSRFEAADLAIEGGIGEVALADAVAGRPIGSARLSLAATRLKAAAGGAQATLAGPSATFEARRLADGRVAARVDLPLTRLAASLPGGRDIGPVGPVRLSASVDDLRADGTDPWTWTGAGKAAVDLPGTHLDLAAGKPGEVVSWDLRLDGLVPGALASLMPASARQAIEGQGPRVTLRAEGTASPCPTCGHPAITGNASGEISQLAVRAEGHRLAVPAMRLALAATLDRRGLDGKASIELGRPRLDGTPLADSLALSAATSPGAGSRRLLATLAARAGGAKVPTLDASAALDWRPAARRLDGSIHGTLRGSAGLWAALPEAIRARLGTLQFDEVSLEGLGHLEGLKAGAAGLPGLPADPGRHLRGAADLTLDAKGVRLKTGETLVAIPGLTMIAKGDATGDTVTATLTLAQPSLDARVGTHSVAATGIAALVKAEFRRDRAFREAALSLTATIDEARQNLWAPYPVRKVALTARGQLQPGVLRLDEFVLDHPDGGTRLALSADAEAGSSPSTGGRATPDGVRPRTLRIEGTLDQDLALLSGDPGVFRGRGTLRIPFRVESGNSSRLALLATVESRDVSMDIPALGFSLTGARGRMPVSEEIEVGPDGHLSIIQGPGDSPWSRVRFHDVNPYLRGGWFAADKVTYGTFTAGPLAGNLQLDRTVLALDQMQASWRGGTVTGQLVVEHDATDTRVWFKGDVTGIEAESGGEGLDANAALRLSLRRTEIDGRVQLLRLGRGHLRDLLNLWDPALANVSANRIRKVLSVGYPRSARVRLDGGFLSARVDLGGIASVIRIDEVRGIPVGPLVRRFLGGVVPARGGTP